jgi:hypothetical protein
MENKDRLPAVVNRPNRLLVVRERATIAYKKTTNHLSILSCFAIILALLFDGVGLYMFALHVSRSGRHDSSIPFLYFGSSVVVMAVYPVIYRSFAVPEESDDDTESLRFDPVWIRARLAMFAIALPTSLSFLLASYQMLSLSWCDPDTGLCCLAGIPVICFIFSLVYDSHCQDDHDMLPAGWYRHTWGRTTIWLLTLLSFVSAVYFLVISTLTGNDVSIWKALAYLTLSFSICFWVSVSFKKRVKEVRDRGAEEG